MYFTNLSFALATSPCNSPGTNSRLRLTRINISIVRGIDYYKGLVFEIEAPSLGAEKQLCGGGAYELIPLFGGKSTPTAGFAIGFEPTGDLGAAATVRTTGPLGERSNRF
jgi:hypothetical protein